ncbi:hypothetical protein LJC48_06750 [Desulfovibrio sp. OttesenSCG-928-C06]|nr:hypothetical protein [Desulfovibrio sp. OttesenSCG-928-C06]
MRITSLSRSVSIFLLVTAMLTFVCVSANASGTASAKGTDAATAPVQADDSAGPEEQPESIPAILQQIIDKRDSAACEERIDFNAVSGHFFDDALPYLNEAVASGKIKLEGALPLLLSSLNSGQPAARIGARAMLGSEARKFVLYGISSGSFAGNPLPKEQLAQLDGGLFASLGSVSTARKEFRNGKQLSNDGTNAVVSTTLFDHGSRKAYNLNLGLEKRGTSWIITSIQNVESLLDKLSQR